MAVAAISLNVQLVKNKYMRAKILGICLFGVLYFSSLLFEELKLVFLGICTVFIMYIVIVHVLNSINGTNNE
jgi:hypothetical protein